MMLTETVSIPSMSPQMIEKVRALEHLARKHKQVKIPVHDYLHGGMYVRTVKIPAGVMVTGVHIVVETNLVVNGHAMIHTGVEWVEVDGYNVLACAARRKQVFVAVSDIELTMFFPTDAKTVKEAEEQFTDEASSLQNRGAECQDSQPQWGFLAQHSSQA